nr:zinc finger and BTB domain-containing protein 41 [Drosophila bipectinata]
MALKRTNLKLVELLQPEEVKVNSAPTSDTAFSEEDFTSDEEKSQEYNNNHTENRCRICYRMLGPDSNDKDLCADENNVLLYYIELIAGVRIQREDGMPNRICSNCHGSLQKAMEFRSNCLKTEFRLKQAKGETFRYESQLSDDDIETELENVLYEESAQNICESSVLDEGSGSDIDLFTDEDEEEKVHGAGPRVVMTRFNKAKVPPDEEEKNGRYFCSECPKSYTSRFSLKVHKNSHTGAKPFKCNVCQQAFRGPGLLRRHMEIHKKLPFHCEICLKGFLLKCQLKDHMLVHTGKRSFWCELCDVYYRYRYNLTKHQKSSLHLDNLLKRSETESQDL